MVVPLAGSGAVVAPTFTELMSTAVPRLCGAHSRRKFVQAARCASRAVFRVPAVQAADEFVRRCQKSANKLVALLCGGGGVEGLLPQKGDGSPYSRFTPKDFDRLTNITEKDVETFVWETNKTARLKSDRMATCLVPYRLAVNFILARLPPELRDVAVGQLRREEQQGGTQGGEPQGSEIRLLQYVEADVYGRRERITKGSRRTPIFVLVGHSGHGKTSLLDRCLERAYAELDDDSGYPRAEATTVSMLRLEQQRAAGSRGDNMSGFDADNGTFGLRGFTLPFSSIWNSAALQQQPAAEPRVADSCSDVDGGASPYPESVTLIDTPGHHLFSEMRLHTMMVADVVLLCVALDEGVKAQTKESVVVALNVDRPVVVLFTKMDVFSDAGMASKALERCLSELKDVGLVVAMCASQLDIWNACGSESDGWKRWRSYFALQAENDPMYQGSVKTPSISVRRKALGICISSARRSHFDLLAAVLRCSVWVRPPRALTAPQRQNHERGTVQAFVLDATKQVYNVEASHVSSVRRSLHEKMHRARNARQERFNANVSATARMKNMRYYLDGNGVKQSAQGNPYMWLTVVVRSGTLRRGDSFVADQCVGIVEGLYDFFGTPMKEAPPGTVAMVLDRHSRSGCPGPGSHVLSMPDHRGACGVHEFRLHLQRYLEIFPHHIELLRPRHLPSNYAYLGNYGQAPELDGSLGMQLLFGAPGNTIGSDPRSLLAGDRPKTVGAFFAALHKESHETEGAQRVARLTASSSPTKDQSSALTAKRHRGDITLSSRSAPDDARVISERLATLQAPFHMATTAEELQTMRSRCTSIGVLLKVDSWFSARILLREVARLGITPRCAMQVAMVRFGQMTLEDFMVVSSIVRVVVCFRTPPSHCPALDKLMEAHRVLSIETDSLSQVLHFIKKTAVALDEECASASQGLTDAPFGVQNGDALGRTARVVEDDVDSFGDASTSLTPPPLQQSTPADPYLTELLCAGGGGPHKVRRGGKQRLAANTNR